MARVRNQETRQMLLVTGDPLDSHLLPEKLELFNEFGEPIMLGGGFTRNVKVDTTVSLTSGQSESSVLTLYPSVRLYRISTNRAARIRLYPTVAMRDADFPRSVGIKPSGNHGRLLEVVTDAALLDLILSPAVDMTSVDLFNSEFYASVTNRSATTGPVIVTYYYFRTE